MNKRETIDSISVLTSLLAYSVDFPEFREKLVKKLEELVANL